MIEAFLIGFAGSATVAIIYGLVIAQREEQIRRYLSSQRKGWVRKRYVRAFVGAVRGRAAVTDTSLLAFLTLLVPFVFSMVCWMVSGNFEQRTQSIESRWRRLQTDPGITKEPNVQSAQEELAALIEEWTRIKAQTTLLVLVLRIVSGLSLLTFYVGWFFWHPFVVMRRRFAYEIERFTLRIQGLASSTELAELAVAESKVVDEKTLQSFVEMTRRVAIRHEIPQLVTTFDLWGDNTSNA
jgi:hypothetical protein